MTHARIQIRDSIAALLSNLATTGPRVYKSRLYSLDDDEVPALKIFTIDQGGQEEAKRLTLGSASAPSLFQRNCPLVIEGHASSDDDVEDLIEQIALEIEIAMSADIVVGSRVIPAVLTTTAKEFNVDGDKQVGVIRLTYVMTYVTAENTPHILE